MKEVRNEWANPRNRWALALAVASAAMLAASHVTGVESLRVLEPLSTFFFLWGALLATRGFYGVLFAVVIPLMLATSLVFGTGPKSPASLIFALSLTVVAAAYPFVTMPVRKILAGGVLCGLAYVFGFRIYRAVEHHRPFLGLAVLGAIFLLIGTAIFRKWAASEGQIPAEQLVTGGPKGWLDNLIHRILTRRLARLLVEEAGREEAPVHSDP